MVDFGDWISKNWIPNGREGYWDSIKLNSDRQPDLMVDSTKQLLQIWKDQKPQVIYFS